MKKYVSMIILFFIFLLCSSGQAHAFSTRHHLINIGKGLVGAPVSILNGAFRKGPKAVKEIWRYEVYGSDKPEKNGLLYKKAFAIWSAPPAEIKAILDGTVEGAGNISSAIKNLLSIFASD